MKKKGGGGDEGGSWMDTYGDLVTLLLCFFVLLYSMSSVDSAKWDLFVRSIYPDGKTPSERAKEEKQDTALINAQVVEDGVQPEGIIGNPEIEQNQLMESDLSQIYLQIARALNEAGVEGVTVSRGEDYTFVVFKDKAFFAGDSSVLTEQGQKTLDIFCDTISGDNDLISQVNVMGHTAQADPNRINSARNDRMLSSMRAAEVCIYIQNKDFLDPDKLVSIGYGQFRPLEENSTSEGRAANRRVEILIIDKEGEVRDLDQYYKDLNEGVNADTTIITTGESAATADEGAAAGISEDTIVLSPSGDADTSNISSSVEGVSGQADYENYAANAVDDLTSLDAALQTGQENTSKGTAG
ncbi:OmpA/MotB family protein [Oribacterium sp. WCC10]|uniref:OmpA/MotB family protein n=1 Tax=Oribacterium sp. WCC10 TaxID=1855343 RepID=UPI0008E8B5FD|nr:flagellar motor protein MotB [Oribacterium sp. WCC10]SFG25014.1 chemotaxis protein MotB [Oribacterium sp. WCC10]